MAASAETKKITGVTGSRFRTMLVVYPLLAAVSVLILYPLCWMIYSAFKPNADIFADVFAFPKHFYLGNFIEIFDEGGMGTFFKNSVFVTSLSMAGLVFFASLAAYVFAMVEFKGKSLLFMFFLLGLMVPPQALIISGYQWMDLLGLLSTYWALIFTYLGWVSFGILVMRDFFAAIPQDLKDAARVDGAGHWDLFIRIMVPLARPSLATVAIFYFMWIWNDFLYPLVYIQEQERFTVPLGVMLFNGRYTIEWGLQMAGLTIATLVPVMVYLAFQKQFVRGVLAGALRG